MTRSMPHTDMTREGGVIAWLPPAVRPYALLARLDRPIGTWLLLLPCWWGIALAWYVEPLRPHDMWTMALFGIGAVVMRACGCTVNDLWDRRLDRAVERTAGRPLAAGDVSVKEAVVFALALALVGLLVLVQLPLVTILLGVLAVPLVVLYPLAKRFTWWPQFVLGLTFNFGALMGWAAVTGSAGLPALLLYAGGVCWTLGYDTIYAHQDVRDDAALGLKSTARLFGAASPWWVAGFYAAAWLLILGAFLAAHAGWLSCLLLVLPAAQLAWQALLWQPDSPSSCLAMFRANRDFGLLVLLAAAL